MVGPGLHGAWDKVRGNDRGKVMGLRRRQITYRMANLRGLVARTGNKKKQMTKHAAAARLHPPKMRRRSHLLTVMDVS